MATTLDFHYLSLTIPYYCIYFFVQPLSQYINNIS